MTKFSQLIYDCGLSVKGAARILNVRYDTARNWSSGKARVKPFAIAKLEELKKEIERIFGDE